jgi:hypothetical protein
MIRWDDKADCPRCNARCHDVVEQRERNRLLIECCFCGTLLEVPGTVSVPGDTTLKYGRFAGMKISDVLLQPNGDEYLEWLAGRTPSLREAIDAVKHATVREAAAIVPAAAVAQPVVAENSGGRQPGFTPYPGRDGGPLPLQRGSGSLFD